MNSRRLMCFILRRGRHTSTSPKQELFASQQKRVLDFRKGSEADMTRSNCDVRFTPESGHS
jgi:hypothetical protein